MNERTGIDKYDKYISEEECNSKEFNRHFKVPRNIRNKENEFNTFDIAVAAIMLSYGTTLFNNEIETPTLSLGLITELVTRKNDGKSKKKVRESIKKLDKSDLFIIETVSKDLFVLRASIEHGYFRFYYEDLKKIQSLGTALSMQKSLHVFIVVTSLIYGAIGTHEDEEKFVCYRSHKTIGKLCGMSRPSTTRALENLEDIEALAVYNVQLKGLGSVRKSVRSTYQNRDKLRRYVEVRLGQSYVRIIENEENLQDDE